MATTVVRYQAKADRADENQRLIEAVFDELHERGLAGFSYQVFRLEDNVSFVHLATDHEDVENPASLQDVAAFRTFVSDIASRCEVAPLAMKATAVGSYH
jgi:hypothetical protein